MTEPLTQDEKIALGKICGCENCEFCHAWHREQTAQYMQEMVRNGRAIALSAREEHIRQWRIEDEQPKR